MKWLLPFLLLGGLVACSAQADDGRAATSGLGRCIPNQTAVCVCGLDKGSQTCDEEGRLSECVCPDGDLDWTPPVPSGPDTPIDVVEGACGNGRIDPGEACDDGNRDSGDGCSADCQPDGAPESADGCPGQAVVLAKDAKVVLAGTTTGFKDDLRATCFDSAGPDRVYVIEPSEDGVLSIDAAFASGFDAVIEVRRGTCGLQTAQVLCQDTLGRPFKNVVPVEKNKNYYLIVDGDLETASGAYTIELSLH